MESITKFVYKLSKENWTEGYDLFFDLFKKKSKYFKIITFAVLSLLFLDQVIKAPDYVAGWLCLGLCLFMVVGGFIKPSMERKNMIEAFDGIAGDTYCLEVFEERIEISTEFEDNKDHLDTDENGEKLELPEIPKSIVEFEDKLLKCYETKDIIILFSKNGNFIIPKSEIDSENIEVLKETLKTKLEKRYVEKL